MTGFRTHNDVTVQHVSHYATRIPSWVVEEAARVHVTLFVENEWKKPLVAVNITFSVKFSKSDSETLSISKMVYNKQEIESFW